MFKVLSNYSIQESSGQIAGGRNPPVLPCWSLIGDGRYSVKYAIAGMPLISKKTTGGIAIHGLLGGKSKYLRNF